MIVGTAGHIDHGKTALVRALTGVDTDRLPEEKRRGITVSLGFAPLPLSNGRTFGLVDVPGHERFVREMVAGAGGVDLALLVVSADEGVMPQTREHLDVCRLLGVRAGVVALTKADLLEAHEPGWEALVRADVEALCEGTFLEDAAIVSCSARTGLGLDDLEAAIVRAAAALGDRAHEGPPFLPIDRAFSLKGFGTVVTGTLLRGALGRDEAVCLLPGAGSLRIRTLHGHRTALDRVRAGQRVAVNLPELSPSEVPRGAVLSRPGEVPLSRRLDVSLELLPSADRSLTRRTRMLLHLGTAQLEATVVLLGAPSLDPGEQGYAQLLLDAPVAALHGQRFVLRGFRTLPGRGATVAGGEVLTLTAPRRRPTRAPTELLKALHAGDVRERVLALVRSAGPAGLGRPELCARTGAGSPELERVRSRLCHAGDTVALAGGRLIASDVLATLERETLTALARLHAEAPERRGISREALRRRLPGVLPPDAFERLLTTLEGKGALSCEGDRIVPLGADEASASPDLALRRSLAERLRAAVLAPPKVAELARELGRPLDVVVKTLRALAEEGDVRRVTEELYFDAEAIEGLRVRLVERLRDGGALDTLGFKALVGQSRKFTIPLAEHFDRERVTLRIGDKRVLRRRP